MKRVLLLTGVLLALGVSAALAGGVNLNWGTLCYSDNPRSFVNFTCMSNSGSWSMVSSFMLDTEMTDMVGLELTMVGTPCWSALPDWWKLGAAPDCRAGLATFASDFSTVSQINCIDWSAGRSSNTFQYTWGPNHAFITASASLPAGTQFDVLPFNEYFAGKVTIHNGKTVGAGLCSGCQYGVWWTMPLLTVLGQDGHREDLTRYLPAGSDLGWQVSACGDPARNTTWGQIKGMYR